MTLQTYWISAYSTRFANTKTNINMKYPIHKGLYCALYLNIKKERFKYDPEDKDDRNRAIRRYEREVQEVDKEIFEATLKQHLEETEKALRAKYLIPTTPDKKHCPNQT